MKYDIKSLLSIYNYYGSDITAEQLDFIQLEVALLADSEQAKFYEIINNRI